MDVASVLSSATPGSAVSTGTGFRLATAAAYVATVCPAGSAGVGCGTCEAEAVTLPRASLNRWRRGRGNGQWRTWRRLSGSIERFHGRCLSRRAEGMGDGRARRNGGCGTSRLTSSNGAGRILGEGSRWDWSWRRIDGGRSRKRSIAAWRSRFFRRGLRGGCVAKTSWSGAAGYGGTVPPPGVPVPGNTVPCCKLPRFGCAADGCELLALAVVPSEF